MHDLIKIENTSIGDESVPTVNARELHALLEIKSHYKDWFRNRVNKYDFQENIDYCCLAKTLATQTEAGRIGSSNYTDHYISLAMAKELCMVENNEKGRQARRYFIECEKQLKQVLSSEEKLIAAAVLSTTVEERVAALSEYQRVIVQPLIEYKEQALPKVSYHDKVLNSPDLVNISEIAKDYPISAIKLNKILQEEGIQYKDKKGEWALYAKYKDKGYASTKTQVVKNGEYEVLKVHLKWTQRGRLFIYDLLKSRDILPVCEQPC